jgi:hypothetical protein
MGILYSKTQTEAENMHRSSVVVNFCRIFDCRELTVKTKITDVLVYRCTNGMQHHRKPAIGYSNKNLHKIFCAEN